MSWPADEETDPDLAQGVTLAGFGGRSMRRGRVGKEAVSPARVGAEVLATGAECTHDSGPRQAVVAVGV